MCCIPMILSWKGTAFYFVFHCHDKPYYCSVRIDFARFDQIRKDNTDKFGRLSLAKTWDSRVAQWKRAGPITQRSVDRNHALLGHSIFLLLFLTPKSVFISPPFTERPWPLHAYNMTAFISFSLFNCVLSTIYYKWYLILCTVFCGPCFCKLVIRIHIAYNPIFVTRNPPRSTLKLPEPHPNRTLLSNNPQEGWREGGGRWLFGTNGLSLFYAKAAAATTAPKKQAPNPPPPSPSKKHWWDHLCPAVPFRPPGVSGKKGKRYLLKNKRREWAAIGEEARFHCGRGWQRHGTRKKLLLILVLPTIYRAFTASAIETSVE